MFSGNRFLEQCTEDESGESWWKRGQTREWIKREKRKRNVKIGGRIVSGGHCRLQRNVPHEL